MSLKFEKHLQKGHMNSALANAISEHTPQQAGVMNRVPHLSLPANHSTQRSTLHLLRTARCCCSATFAILLATFWKCIFYVNLLPRQICS